MLNDSFGGNDCYQDQRRSRKTAVWDFPEAAADLHQQHDAVQDGEHSAGSGQSLLTSSLSLMSLSWAVAVMTRWLSRHLVSLINVTFMGSGSNERWVSRHLNDKVSLSSSHLSD